MQYIAFDAHKRYTWAAVEETRTGGQSPTLTPVQTPSFKPTALAATECGYVMSIRLWSVPRNEKPCIGRFQKKHAASLPGLRGRHRCSAPVP